MDAIRNFAKATVLISGNYDASATEIDMEITQGAVFPTPPFNAVWWNKTDYPDPADDPGHEIIRVTAQDGDTLTIERAQELTAAADHNEAGKVYGLMAGLTIETIRQMVGNLDTGVSPFIAVDLANDSVAISGIGVGGVTIGDIQGAGNSGVLAVNDNDGVVAFSNIDIGTTQVVSASGPVGTVVGKLPIKDAGGTLLGYLPIYNAIT